MDSQDVLLAQVCRMFADVLRIADVGPDEDFFELGGHSLLAGRLTVKIRHATGARVRLADFIDKPTPREVVSAITRASEATAR